MIYQIHQDRAVAVAPLPRPLVDTHRLERGRAGYGSGVHEPEQSGRTGGDPKSGHHARPGLPAKGEANGPQCGDQPLGFPRVRGHKIGSALGKNTPETRGIPADKLADRQLELPRLWPPREVSKVALIPAMPGGRGRRTAGAARRRSARRPLDREPLVLHADVIQLHPTGRGKEHVEQWGHTRCSQTTSCTSRVLPCHFSPTVTKSQHPLPLWGTKPTLSWPLTCDPSRDD
jgi:hypothetical protein